MVGGEMVGVGFLKRQSMDLIGVACSLLGWLVENCRKGVGSVASRRGRLWGGLLRMMSLY